MFCALEIVNRNGCLGNRRISWDAVNIKCSRVLSVTVRTRALNIKISAHETVIWNMPGPGHCHRSGSLPQLILVPAANTRHLPPHPLFLCSSSGCSYECVANAVFSIYWPHTFASCSAGALSVTCCLLASSSPSPFVLVITGLNRLKWATSDHNLL